MPLWTLNYTEYLFVSIEAPLLKSIQQKLKGKKKKDYIIFPPMRAWHKPKTSENDGKQFPDAFIISKISFLYLSILIKNK